MKIRAEVHIVDGGHFALDTAADEIADLAKGFMEASHSEVGAGASVETIDHAGPDKGQPANTAY